MIQPKKIFHDSVVLGLAFVVLACGTTPTLDAGGADAGGRDGGPVDSGFVSQADYTYPGCTDPGVGGCPRMLVLYCGLEAVTTKYAACAQDADCEIAEFDGRCSGYPKCPGPVVNKQSRVGFDAEFKAEIDTYCPADGGGCNASEGLCNRPLSDFAAACVSGRCRAVVRDGGM